MMYRLALAGLAVITLAACGDTRTERGLTGAGIGAGVGAAGAAATGGNVLGGAALGGAAGGATGALTEREDLDIGDAPDL